MRHSFFNKKEAFEWAQERAQRLGNDQLVVLLENGKYAAGSEKKVRFFYPNLNAWWFRYQY